MADLPWLTLIGLGEDGADGLSTAARAALEAAELVFGATRHLSLLPALKCEARAWPVPFTDGIPVLLAERGRRVVLLASGDPFWFGAGTSVARHLTRDEWIAHPVPSSFAFAASRLGWALQDTTCLGLHAAPFSQLRPHLAPGQHLLATVRDGTAVHALATYLGDEGFGASKLHVLEALGGPRERVRSVRVDMLAWEDIAHPVLVGIEPASDGSVLPLTSGRPDGWFESDGQLTRQPVRALTLSALAPRAGELLWDIGAGSGSIGIEWLLAHPANRATAIEADSVRADRARANATRLGVDRLKVLEGRAPAVLPEGVPDAVFIGGGLSCPLLEALWARLPTGARLVANAVTLESEALLARWHGAEGGCLLRIELADAMPLGTRHGWRSRYPVVQWSVTR